MISWKRMPRRSATVLENSVSAHDNVSEGTQVIQLGNGRGFQISMILAASFTMLGGYCPASRPFLMTSVQESSSHNVRAYPLHSGNVWGVEKQKTVLGISLYATPVGRQTNNYSCSTLRATGSMLLEPSTYGTTQ